MKAAPHFSWLVILFAIPFWLAASCLDATKIIPVKLPLSALQFLSVLLAAIVVTHYSGGSVRELLLRGIDMERIKNRMWRVGIFVLMPLTVGLSYLMTLWSGANTSDKMTPLLSIPIFLLVYGISGYSEQIGWTAIMTDNLLKHHTVIMTGLIVGTTWAAWHLIPFIQTHNTAVDFLAVPIHRHLPRAADPGICAKQLQRFQYGCSARNIQYCLLDAAVLWLVIQPHVHGNRNTLCNNRCSDAAQLASQR